MARLRLGRYSLMERIGGGGMAEVWRAHAEDGRVVALKRLLPHLGPEAAAAFAEEARLAKRLDHPNLLRALDAGDGFWVMELVSGPTLAALIRAHPRPIDPAVGVFVVGRVLSALAYLHALAGDDGRPLGLIHRDVTPSNILLGADGGVRLGDLGIAKPLHDDERTRTETGVLKGKPGFLAPEQVAGGPVDQRADLFAAGVVLHEALTGRRLFKGETAHETLALVREKNIPPPSERNPRVGPALDAICQKALARDPADRYSSASEMEAALAALEPKLGAKELSRLVAQLFPAAEPTAATVAPAARSSRRWLWLLAIPIAAAVTYIFWPRVPPIAPPIAQPIAPPIAQPIAPPIAKPIEKAIVQPIEKPLAPHHPHHKRERLPQPLSQPLQGGDELKGAGTVDPFATH